MGIVFIDLDGVLVDLMLGIELRMDVQLDYTTYYIDFMDKFGITEQKFWETMSTSDWANLPKTKDTDEILSVVEKYKPIILSAHPGFGIANSVAGKIRWIEKNLPKYYQEDRWFFGRGKERLAHENAILIDDHEYNTNKWTKAGGTSILVPRPWNILGRGTNLSAAEYITDRLEWILGAQNENRD